MSSNNLTYYVSSNNNLKFQFMSASISSATPFASSGSTYIWGQAPDPPPIKENQEITVTLLDGTEVSMTFKDYIQFTVYNNMIPSDCKDLAEFNEKMMVFRI